MRMAKASEDDLKAALDLCGVLEDIDKGYFPRSPGRESAPDDPMFFDEDDAEHLAALYERIKACLDAAPGGLFRVVFGMACLLDPKNRVVCPDADHLKLHPMLEAAVLAVPASSEET